MDFMTELQQCILPVDGTALLVYKIYCQNLFGVSPNKPDYTHCCVPRSSSSLGSINNSLC